MLTKKQLELLNFIHAHLEKTGISPSFEEMKEALDLKSKSGIHRLVTALEERGYLRRLKNRARALEVLRLPGEEEGAKPKQEVSLAVPRQEHVADRAQTQGERQKRRRAGMARDQGQSGH